MDLGKLERFIKTRNKRQIKWYSLHLEQPGLREDANNDASIADLEESDHSSEQLSEQISEDQAMSHNENESKQDEQNP